jgi:hypothetical protein
MVTSHVETSLPEADLFAGIRSLTRGAPETMDA